MTQTLSLFSMLPTRFSQQTCQNQQAWCFDIVFLHAPNKHLLLPQLSLVPVNINRKIQNIYSYMNQKKFFYKKSLFIRLCINTIFYEANFSYHAFEHRGPRECQPYESMPYHVPVRWKWQLDTAWYRLHIDIYLKYNNLHACVDFLLSYISDTYLFCREEVICLHIF